VSIFFDAGDLFSGEEEGGIRIKSHLLFDSIVWSDPWGRGGECCLTWRFHLLEQ